MDEISINEQPKASDTDFTIIGATDDDSLGSDKWKDYLKGGVLEEAWKPPYGSPYERFFKSKTIRAVEMHQSKIKPRYSEGEETSEQGIQHLIQSGALNRETAVILDSGGAHSVAMAIKLAEIGYQPVVMFDSIPHPQGYVRSEQGLATLLYFAQRMTELKAQGVIKPDAPPVFTLDLHRDDRTDVSGRTRVDNTYTYTTDDFPTADDLSKQGIARVIYLNEANKNGKIDPAFQSPTRLKPDLIAVSNDWANNGIDLLYTGIDPRPETEKDGPKSKYTYKNRFNLPDDNYPYPDIIINFKKKG